MSLRRGLTARALGVGVLAVLAAGCATYTAKLADLRPQLQRGDYELALATLDKGAGGKDAVLVWLERGMILHQAGRWVESNEAFAAAERTARELEARSLSEGAVSLLTNDQALAYRARPFELGMVPYYRALNYVALGERESALVEARKASLLLAQSVDATLGGIERGSTSDFQRTRNDPFLLYFTGMMYDWDGELNDAFIAYRNAAVAYQDLHRLLALDIPPWLGGDLRRTGRQLGFAAELEQLQEACPIVFAAADSLGPGSAARGPAPGQGEVVVLVEVGFVPLRRETKLNLPIFESDRDDDRRAWAWDLSTRAHGGYVYPNTVRIKYWLTVAVPGLQAAPAAVQFVAVRAPQGGTVAASVAHHPAAAASVTFAAEQPTLLFKTVLRGLTKYLATREVDKQGRAFGVLANILGAATETADTRSWLTLPERIHLVRLRLPAGVHDLEVELRDTSGRLLRQESLGPVAVRSGDWTFARHRVYDF
jgi:hypothetical protein